MLRKEFTNKLTKLKIIKLLALGGMQIYSYANEENIYISSNLKQNLPTNEIGYYVH